MIENENQLLSGAPPYLPHADENLFQEFAQFKPSSPNYFTANEFFTSFQERNIQKQFDKIANKIISEIKKARKIINVNSSLLKKIKETSSGPNIQCGTRYIFRELARFFCIDQKITPTKNHAIDLLHSVVPVAYCDYVLLDKHWEAQIYQLLNRFKTNKISIVLASVFSKKNNGIEKFLTILNDNHL